MGSSSKMFFFKLQVEIFIVHPEKLYFVSAKMQDFFVGWPLYEGQIIQCWTSLWHGPRVRDR